MFYQAKKFSGKFFVCIKKAENLKMMFGEHFYSFQCPISKNALTKVRFNPLI
jgi:hypothetical protein